MNAFLVAMVLSSSAKNDERAFLLFEFVKDVNQLIPSKSLWKHKSGLAII